jgi:hypothetical protein
MKSPRAITVLAGLILSVAMVPIPTAGAAAAVDPCRLPGGVLDVSDLAGRSAVACGAVGRLVDAGDVLLPIPAPGSGVILGQLYPEGTRTYTVATDAQGVVTATVQLQETTTEQSASVAGGGRHEADEFPDTPDVPGACERDVYTLAGFKWFRPWLYRTNADTALANDDRSDFVAASRRALRNMTDGHNTCGLRDGISAVGGFIGHTTAHGNFVTDGDQTTCGTPDSRNVLDEGDFPGGFLEALLASYCVWTKGTRQGYAQAVEADLRFNDTDYSWTYNPNDPSCDGVQPPDQVRWRYDVESVLTHEVGHVFGLVNIAAELENVNQTMFPGIRRCTGHFRTLGLGDMLGMRALY